MFCFHKWKIIKEQSGELTPPKQPKRDILRYVLQCQKCGDVKSKIIDL